VNDIILRAKTEDEIYAKICEIAVHSGNFIYAWLGVEDKVNDVIKALYWFGSSTIQKRH
jgi:hypothetical protein